MTEPLSRMNCKRMYVDTLIVAVCGYFSCILPYRNGNKANNQNPWNAINMYEPIVYILHYAPPPAESVADLNFLCSIVF